MAKRGASELVNKLPGFDRLDAWEQTAYLGLCKRTGTATTLLLSETAIVVPNGSVLIFGTDDYPHKGRVMCGSNVSTADAAYTVTVRLGAYDPHGAVVECFIDGTSFGVTHLYGNPTNNSFPLRLGAGYHTFTTRDLGFAFRFFNFTLWTTPIFVPT